MIAIMLMLMCQLITLAVPMVVQKVIDSLSSAHITIHIWKITLFSSSDYVCPFCIELTKTENFIEY